MVVAVTGGAGHIGANLVRALLARGTRVRALIHEDRRALEGLNVDVRPGDICNKESLIAAFDGTEVVYHLAADISLLSYGWRMLEETNVYGVRNVVEACLHCGVRRLVHFSSIHAIMQEPLNMPIDESRPLADCGPPYDRSKAAGEREVIRGIEKGLDAIIINPTAVIGINDYRPSHFGEVLLFLANRKLPILVTGGFDWVDVRDVVEGAMRAEERAPTGAKYLLSGHWVSLCDTADLVGKITGAPAPGLVSPMWLARFGAPFVTAYDRLTGRRPLYTSVSLRAMRSNRNISHQKASLELGYSPRPFEETIVDTLRWFEKEGKLEKPLKPDFVKYTELP
jgi:dihydroflavonol-4-reductase